MFTRFLDIHKNVFPSNIELSLDCDFVIDKCRKKDIRMNIAPVITDETKNTLIMTITFLILCG